MKSFFLEGYGCSLNIGETEQISGFLKKNNFQRIKDFKKANFIIINTCSVKMVTEQRMLSRINFLLNNKKKNAKIIVTGCLAKTNKKKIENISKDLIVLDTKLESLANFFSLKEECFSPKIIEEKSHKNISIIPISVGCVGNCYYCSTKIARGALHSYSIKEINDSFKRALKTSKEIWITSQDLGCYGFDTGYYLPELIKTLLKNNGNYRIRLGMMNPKHFKKIRKGLIPLFKDDRLYKFLHLPVQSGSDKILKKMNRQSSKKDFIDAINYSRKRIPNIRISTDIIVGFPGETEKDFENSLKLIEKIKPNVLNISRFGKREGTVASKLKEQILESEKKRRSKILSDFSKKLFFDENKKLEELEFRALVSEKAKNNGFVARTDNYSPVLVNNFFGEFVKIKISTAFPHFFKGEILEKLK
ncbi:MAG: tRNA (N(6)-L-threonylcarbamoyladenosine(37)-C(2))-methylthiotransferase [Candidatus ainarchaeum sp.]|nr:tRNA (N(6)-L-threonylcarbamoyladenosine(37)-C(2))-methylthiotransferase [Candidatus ainarchaeum sp.]